MKYKKVVRLYSNSRVSKYYKATNRNKNKAVMLYFANMKTWIDPEIMPSLREVDKVCKIIEKEENKQKQ